MADTRYYPWVPWDDNEVTRVEFSNHTIHDSIIHYNSIYGPAFSPIYRLVVQGLGLCAQDQRTLVVQES